MKKFGGIVFASLLIILVAMASFTSADEINTTANVSCGTVGFYSNCNQTCISNDYCEGVAWYENKCKCGMYDYIDQSPGSSITGFFVISGQGLTQIGANLIDKGMGEWTWIFVWVIILVSLIVVFKSAKEDFGIEDSVDDLF